VRITTYQPDTKSTPNTNPNHNPTAKQHVIVNIQLNIVTCPMYPDKFIRDNVVAQSVQLQIDNVMLPALAYGCHALLYYVMCLLLHFCYLSYTLGYG